MTAWNRDRDGNLQVVIADDDPVQRWLLKTSLTQGGYTVRETTNGRDAWNVLQAEALQIIVTNWMMPERDGLELIRDIRATCVDRYVYIILLTARDGKPDVVDGLQAGADDYLTKPFNPGELLARVAIGQRILGMETHLREARDRERELARRDSLTGLFNRRAIYERAEAALDQAIAQNRPLSLILLDIDHFKHVNDQYGHLVGDQALYLIAATVARNKRATDLVGRWGGEEFLLVLPETTLMEATVVAERVRNSVADARLRLADGGSLQRTVSLGVASLQPGDPMPLDVLLQQADNQLLRAKAEGRNRTCFPLTTQPDLQLLLNGRQHQPKGR